MAKDVIEAFQGAEVSLRVLLIVASRPVKRETKSGVLGSKNGAGKGSLGPKQADSAVAAKVNTSCSLDTKKNLRTTIAKT